MTMIPASRSLRAGVGDRGGWLGAGARRRRALTLVELLAAVIVIGALAGIVLPRFQELINRAKVAKAIGDLKGIQTDIDSRDSLPETLAEVNRDGYLDPWGTPYVYYKFPESKSKGPPKGARRDRFLVPVNSEYDLYSMGADGKSSAPFTAKASHDDVVRANGGHAPAHVRVHLPK